MACSVCGEPGHYAPRCPKGQKFAAPRWRRRAREAVEGAGVPRNPEAPLRRVSPLHLPLYLNPLPRLALSPETAAACRRLLCRGGENDPTAFEHVTRETQHGDGWHDAGTITHRWRSREGRTITAVCPRRPLDCRSTQWFWEGLIVLRWHPNAESVRAEMPSAAVTESADASTAEFDTAPAS